MTAGTYHIDLDRADRDRFDALLETEGDAYTFTTDRVEAFVDATDDDHPLHVGGSQYMERFNEVYDNMLADERAAEGVVRPRNVVHGVYTLTASLALLDADPAQLSARFETPVFHADDVPDSVEPVAVSPENVHDGLHRYTITRDDRSVATFTYSDAETETADGVYALCRGMGAFDREGDVLLAFPLVTFTATDLDGVTELVLDRTLHREHDHPRGMIRTYRNDVTTGDGQGVVTYLETDLELGGYDDVF